MYQKPDLITVLPNGISEPKRTTSIVTAEILSRLESDKFKILSVGNVVREKGFDLLFEAVANLISQGYSLQVVIVGSGPDDKYLAEKVRLLHLESVVILVSRQPNDVVRSLYPHFDAFVLPSYSETFGIVYIEAMYAQLPVIGVKGQGIDGIITHGKEGLLSQPRSIVNLMEQIQLLIDEPAKAKQMALSGQKLVKERFQLNRIMDKLRAFYEQ
jgi:glycosyltransferase involved in cell wall biosynthesis